VVLTPLNTSSQLSSFSTSAASYLGAVQAANTALDGSSNLALTTELLVAMQSLSNTAATLANVTLLLSGQLLLQAPMLTLSALNSSLGSMLKLSSDIGTIADRIGEMADRILVMANNIGTMSDRILATQVIQSTNLTLAANVLLQTQRNALALFPH
jgi:hypothetical protein